MGAITDFALTKAIEPDNEEVRSFAARVGTPSRPEWVLPYVIATIRAHRLFFFKKKPGDCGSDTSISLGTGAKIARAADLGAAGAGTAAALGAGAAAATAAAALTGVGLIALPFAIFGAHHAKAVAQEQATACSVSVGVNQVLEAIEQALVRGEITLEEARAEAQRLEQAALEQLATIKKAGRENLAFGMEFAVRALILFESEKVFPTMVSGKLGKSGLAIAAGAAALIAGVARVFSR